MDWDSTYVPVEVHSVDEVKANSDTGLEGDHFKKSSTDKRDHTDSPNT